MGWPLEFLKEIMSGGERVADMKDRFCKANQMVILKFPPVKLKIKDNLRGLRLICHVIFCSR